jgi:hypothetical protein
MIEAWNRKFKYVIVKKFKALSHDDLIERLPQMITYANKLKLPTLNTLSPFEVLRGMKVDDIGLRIKMEQAKYLRLKQNRAMNCEVVCLTPLN